jgi:hypothetical protein
VPQEEATLPGEWPGIYACDRRKLLAVYNATLRAALATLHGDVAAAEVRAWRRLSASIFDIGCTAWYFACPAGLKQESQAADSVWFQRWPRQHPLHTVEPICRTAIKCAP